MTVLLWQPHWKLVIHSFVCLLIEQIRFQAKYKVPGSDYVLLNKIYPCVHGTHHQEGMCARNSKQTLKSHITVIYEDKVTLSKGN